MLRVVLYGEPPVTDTDATGVIFHGDRGSRYLSADYATAITGHDMVQSVVSDAVDCLASASVFFRKGVVLQLKQVLEIVFLVVASFPIPSLIREQLPHGARVFSWGLDLGMVRIDQVERKLCSQLDILEKVIVVWEKVPHDRDGHISTLRPLRL